MAEQKQFEHVDHGLAGKSGDDASPLLLDPKLETSVTPARVRRSNFGDQDADIAIRAGRASVSRPMARRSNGVVW